MRERLLGIIQKLADRGWKPNTKFMLGLTQIAEDEPTWVIEELIEDVFEAFR